MKKTVLVLCSLMVSASAMAVDSAHFVCKVKSSTMRMYSKRADYQLMVNATYLEMDNGSKVLKAGRSAQVAAGTYIINENNLLSANDEWMKGTIYLGKSMLQSVEDGNQRDGEMTVVDTFSDGTEKTVFSCEAGVE